MRIFDFSIQTLLILAALSTFLLGRDALIFIAVIQFFIGCWQLLSGIITTFKYRNDDGARKKYLKVYWILVASYFVALGGVYALLEKEMAYIVFYSAWIIAIYYFVITIQMMSDNQKDKKTFLDLVN